MHHSSPRDGYGSKTCICKTALDQLAAAWVERRVLQHYGALCRLAQVEDAKAKLQEALTHAERQLAASEARMTSLQSAVEKSEERAASLDLQVKAKSNPASGKYLQSSPRQCIGMETWLATCLDVYLHIRTVGLAWLQNLAPQPVC